MLPSSRDDGNPSAVGCIEQDQRLFAGALAQDADAMDRHAEERAPDFCAWRGCEEKLVVLASVESESERLFARGGTKRKRVDGQRGFLKSCGEAGFFAEVGEVGGEAVADVDHGVGERAQAAALGEARLGVEMRMARRSLREPAEFFWMARECEQFGRGSAEAAGDIEEIAGARGGSQARMTARKLPDSDDVGADEAGGFGGVSPGEGNTMTRGEREKSVEEAVEPGGGQTRGQRKREKHCERLRAHGGQIAESAGEAAVTGGFGRMEIAVEVAAFEREVGRDADFVAGFGTDDGAVIADAGNQGGSPSGCGAAADVVDNGKFTGEDAGAFHD